MTAMHEAHSGNLGLIDDPCKLDSIGGNRTIE